MKGFVDEREVGAAGAGEAGVFVGREEGEDVEEEFWGEGGRVPSFFDWGGDCWVGEVSGLLWCDRLRCR